MSEDQSLLIDWMVCRRGARPKPVGNRGPWGGAGINSEMNNASLTLPPSSLQTITGVSQDRTAALEEVMFLTVVFRTFAILVIFLQLSCSSSLPVRNKRHVDGMFTSEFSRARGSAAIRKIINSALQGKRDVEESSNQPGPQMDFSRRELSGLEDNTFSEPRWDDLRLNKDAQNQLSFAILNLLSRMPLQSPKLRNTQDY